MVNSGTEAVMSALRAARGYTGRKKDHKICRVLSRALRCNVGGLVRSNDGRRTGIAGVPAGCARIR